MVDRAETVLKGKNGIWDRWEIGEAEVTSPPNDTITLDNFDSSQNLLTAYVFRKVTGAEITCTKASNVITITGACTNADCFYVAYGYKA